MLRSALNSVIMLMVSFMNSDDYEHLRKFYAEKKPPLKHVSVRRGRAGANPPAPERPGGAGRERPGSVKAFPERDGERARGARKRGNAAARFVSFCLFAVFFVYLAFYFVNYLNSDTPTTIQVIYGSVDVPLVHSGIIIRDEKVYQSPRAGSVIYRVNDGDRVKKSSLVCDVRDAAEAAAIEAKLAAINGSILEMQENRGGLSLYESDYRAANAIIKNQLDEYSSRLAGFDIKSLYALREKVQQALDIRNGLLLSETGGSLVSLSQQREIYGEQLENYIGRVVCEESGVVSYKTDGLEETLRPEGRFGVPREYTEMTVDYDKIMYSKDAKPSDPVFKIIKSNEWYIAAYIRNSAADSLKEGAAAALFIEKEQAARPSGLEMTVERIERGESESYVVFKGTKYMADFLNCRSIRFKINQGVTQGLKIPNSAIAEKIMLKIPDEYIFEKRVNKLGYPSRCVTKKTAEGDLILPLSFLGGEEDYSYVLQEPGVIERGDVLVSGDGAEFYLSDFDSVKGVYLVNSGAPVFTRIDTGGDNSSNSEYTILDPALNKNVRVADSIIADWRTVAD